MGPVSEHGMQVVADDQSAADRDVLRFLEAGRIDEANQLFDELLAAPQPESDRLTRASRLIFRAAAAWRLGRTPLSLELAAEGWTELDAGPVEGVAAAQAIGRLGYLLDAVGRRREALDMARRSIRTARASGDTETLAHCLQRLGGGLNLVAGDTEEVTTRRALFDEARACLEEGLDLVTDARMHRSLLGSLARSLVGLDELDRAAELAQRTVELSRAAEHGWGLSVGLWVLGMVHRKRGETARARALLVESIAAAESMEDMSLMRVVGLELAAVGRQLRDAQTEVEALRTVIAADRASLGMLREGLGQALEQRRIAVRAQRLALAAQQAAARDPLTGLTNRLGLEQTAPVLLDAAIGSGRVAWLLIVDVDHFKVVNDDLGHPAGDAVLRQVARILRQECRTGDLIARWAGDEFVVLLAAEPVDGAAGVTVAERVRAAVASADWSLTGVGGPGPTVSIGVASGVPELDVLFSRADAALYKAKRMGRDRVVQDPAMR